jgi:hypothetical protein
MSTSAIKISDILTSELESEWLSACVAAKHILLLKSWKEKRRVDYPICDEYINTKKINLIWLRNWNYQGHLKQQDPHQPRHEDNKKELKRYFNNIDKLCLQNRVCVRLHSLEVTSLEASLLVFSYPLSS